MTIIFTQDTIDNFNKCIDKKSDSECWMWNKTVDKNGYGRAWYKLVSDGKRIARRANRIAVMISTNSLIPPGLVAMHSCDNPGCCNPNHLSLGTVLDNNMDKIYKGRANSAKGTRNAQAKLTEEDVISIRSRVIVGTRPGYNQPTNVRELAEEYNVNKELIRQIAKRNIWKHI